jgi:hypothetical protein
MKRKTQEQAEAEADAVGVKLLTVFVSCRDRAEYQCRTCGHVWKTLPSEVQQGIGCTKCDGKRHKKTQAVAEAQAQDIDATLIEKFTHSHKKITYRCNKCQHEWLSKPCYVQQGNGCPKCSGKCKETKGAQDEASLVGAKLLESYVGSKTTHTYSCEKDQNHPNWLARPNDIQQGHGCPKCANVGPSKPQLQIYEYIKSILPPDEEIHLSTRKVIAPKEIDIYVPSRKFALEYNGLYWHSDGAPSNFKSGKERDKALDSQALGLSYLMVFGDEWESKPDLIKAMIQYRLGLFSGQKLHARKLELRLLGKNSQWDDFFNRNHLDGSAMASWGYGLFHGDKMVVCATVRTNHKAEVELARLATDYDYSVSGGATRVIKAIKTKLEGKPLTTFSNNRLSSGALYASLGKEITETTRPSYYYTDGKVRVWRFKCKRINDLEVLARYPNVEHTEKAQAAGGVFSEFIFGDNRPLFRIEDAGHRKWLI